MDKHLPAVGTRINYNTHLGTIRYVGPVDNTNGIWLGVEWDDPSRGKHNGSKDGKQYFTCRFETAGSFIRPTSHIAYGLSFLEALSSKYIEALHGSQSQEKVVLGSSQGAIQVEAVSLDKIREKFARLDRLREVSLDHGDVARGDAPGSIAKTCPNIRGLDLSQNLLPSWETVASIARELPLLQRLALNHNRLELPLNYECLKEAFLKLTEIHLNETLMTWTEMQAITAFMPCLQIIEMGYNHLSRLVSGTPLDISNSVVEVLNLDSNYLSEWIHICASLREYKSLQRVVLTANPVEAIPFPAHPSECLPGVQYLSLSDNRISSWAAVDALSCWFPGLKTLTMSGNPLVTDTQLGKHSRPFIIARIPSLVTLDGATVSSRERTDSELFYMSSIIQQGSASEERRQEAHYRWGDLCEKHGRPDEIKRQKTTQDKLINHLINLKLYQYDESMDRNEYAFSDAPKASLRVLPSMSLRIFRLKVCKTLKYDVRRTNLICWLRMGDGSLTKLDMQYDSRDLDWLGVEDGSQIIYQGLQ